MISTAADMRFDAKVMVNPATGCHEWQAALSGPGKHKYGVFGVGGKTVKAHRYAYARERGPIPEGMHLDHLCRNPRCVNPYHLEAVTQGENHRRADWRQKTHCKRGHALTPDNVYRKPNGGHRQCRECKRLTANAFYARHASIPLLNDTAGLLSLAFI